MFSQAGIVIGPGDRMKADRIIHEVVGITDDKDCPNAWAAVKVRLEREREGFISDLSSRWELDRK